MMSTVRFRDPITRDQDNLPNEIECASYQHQQHADSTHRHHFPSSDDSSYTSIYGDVDGTHSNGDGSKESAVDMGEECVCCRVRILDEPVEVDPLSRACLDLGGQQTSRYLTDSSTPELRDFNAAAFRCSSYRKSRSRVLYTDYAFTSNDDLRHPGVKVTCGHVYCDRCFHRYACAGELNARVSCMTCGCYTDLAKEATSLPVSRYRLRSATSICVDRHRKTFLVVDSILNRCFEFPTSLDLNSDPNRDIGSVRSHALLVGTTPTFGIVAMEKYHVITTRDHKRCFLAFYSLKGEYVTAIYLPSNVDIKGLDQIYTKFEKSHVDFAWILADASGCRLLKVAASDEVQSIPLDHVTPAPRIQALCTSPYAPEQRVFVSDAASGNVLEVDTVTGSILRSLGVCLASASWLFATPTRRLLVADPVSACVRSLPTEVQICVTADFTEDDQSTPTRSSALGSNEPNDVEGKPEVDTTWRPVQYDKEPCCLLRPVGVAWFDDTVAVLLSAVGNVEISEVRFYRM